MGYVEIIALVFFWAGLIIIGCVIAGAYLIWLFKAIEKELEKRGYSFNMVTHATPCIALGILGLQCAIIGLIISGFK